MSQEGHHFVYYEIFFRHTIFRVLTLIFSLNSSNKIEWQVKESAHKFGKLFHLLTCFPI